MARELEEGNRSIFSRALALALGRRIKSTRYEGEPNVLLMYDSGKERTTEGVALNSATLNLTRVLGPIIGGLGTLFGPILGAAVLTVLADGITELLAALGWEFPGVKQVFYGLVLLGVVMFLPHGIWPTLARKLGVAR